MSSDASQSTVRFNISWHGVLSHQNAAFEELFYKPKKNTWLAVSLALWKTSASFSTLTIDNGLTKYPFKNNPSNPLLISYTLNLTVKQEVFKTETDTS